MSQPMLSDKNAHAPAPVERTGMIATAILRTIAWVGSPSSLLLHTIVFVGFFLSALARLIDWNSMLLVLTTILSLEAIYLAIFLQFSVNRQAASIKGVEEDVESIQEDVAELGEHVEGLKEDVEEIQEEIVDDASEERRKRKQAEMLEALTNDVKAMLRHLESLKAGSP